MARIWIDTDLALGERFRDPDDAFAVAAVAGAQRAGSAELLGISTVFGNTTAARASRRTRSLLAVARVSCPLVEGAGRAGEVTEAARAIAKLPDGASLLAIGPLTNVAAAIAIDPTLPSRITVRLVGGNLSSRGRFAPWWPFEFNLAKDAAAARAVMAAPFRRRRVFPLDVCRRLVLPPAALARLAVASPVGAALARGSLSWLAYAPLRYRSLAFPLWDLVPALDALGEITVVCDERACGVGSRGQLVRGGAPSQPSEFARWFDTHAALRAFTRLHAEAL